MKFGFITDLHARSALQGSSVYEARQSRKMEAFLPVALSNLKEQGARAVLMAGDLLDVPESALDGDPEALAAYHADALRDYRTFQHLLEACGLPFATVPGNHDRLDWMHEVFPKATAPEPLLDGVLMRFADAQDDRFMPHRLGKGRGRFEQAVGNDDPTPQIHLQHYLLTPCLNDRYPHTYPDGEVLADALAECSAPVLSLSGHYHHGVALEERGNAWFFTGEAFCESPHPYYLIEWDGEHAPRIERHPLA